MFARVKIEPFYLRLRVFKRAADHFVLNGLVFGNTKPTHHRFDRVRCKHAHERIFQRNEKLRSARIALTPRSSAELVVNAPRFVPLGSQHEQPAESLYLFVLFLARRVSAKLNIHAASRHVRSHDHGPFSSALSDDLSFTFMLFGVEHLMRYALFVQIRGEQLVFFNRNRTDEYWLACVVKLFYFFRDRFEFSLFRLENQVVPINTRHPLIGRDGNNLKSVDFIKFLVRSKRRTGHAGELFIETKIILKRDGGNRA